MIGYYIYLFRERLIHWMPQTLSSKPVSFGPLKWYVINSPPPLSINDMTARGDIGYSIQKGFYTIEEPLPRDWDRRELLVKKIEILAGFISVSNSQKARYTDNTIGQPLADALLLDEIREFRQARSFDNCPILSGLAETNGAGFSPEGLVMKMWLVYESYRNVLVHLNRLEFKIRKLLEDEKFDEAVELLNLEIEKMRV
jgi:hypothetical protein